MVKSIINFFTSLKLTVTCLCLALLLVFIGTLAQVDEGLYAAQNRYFRSFMVYWGPKDAGWKIPIFPGGYLVGAVLLINLISAHIKRFTFSKKKIGIFLTHIGLIMLLLGGLLTDLFQVESHMRLAEGEAKNYSENGRANELVITDTTDPLHDEVVAIPDSLLVKQNELRHSQLPFTLCVKRYFPNTEPKFRPPAEAGAGTTQGVGQRLQFISQPLTTTMDARDIPAAEIEVAGSQGALGEWWVSNWVAEETLLKIILRQAGPAMQKFLTAPQTFTHNNRTYRLAMRPIRYYEPYSIELIDFRHDRYKGTDVPKNFSSDIRLRNSATGEEREVHISMNNPLRYQGKTYFQAGFDENDPRVTILQVVRNPSWLGPYISCSIMGLGLVIQFLTHLIGFARKKAASKVASTKAAGALVAVPAKALRREEAAMPAGVSGNGDSKSNKSGSKRRRS